MEMWIYCTVTQILLYLSTVSCYDVHINKDLKHGSLLFNASHSEPHWRYSLDQKKSDKQIHNLITVDSVTGLVKLKTSPIKCRYLAQNPAVVFVEAQRKDAGAGIVSYSQTPLHLHVHGEHCFAKKRKHRLVHSHTMQQISTELSIAYDTCLEKLSHVMKLPYYLPESISKCAFEYRLSAGAREHFVIDQITGELRTAKEVCFTWPYYILHGKIDTVCSSDGSRLSSSKVIQIPFKLMLYGKDTTTTIDKHNFHRRQQKLVYPSTAIEAYTEMMIATTTKKRSRRQAMNTPPSFPQRQYMKHIAEGQPVGTVISTFTATDPDMGPAGELTYSLVATRDGRSQNMFKIDPESGQVTTTVVLDRESIATHSFQIIAVDSGRPPQQAMASLMVRVDDINDHAPRFESQFYSHSISESVSIGSTVITVRASDEDDGKNSELEYSILNPGGANDVFRIEPYTGSITTRLPLDREKMDFYTLQIQATDKAIASERKTATAVVELTILDENDNYPQFSKSSYTVDVSEDIDPSNTPVIANIEATDVDTGFNGRVRYSITGGNTRETFRIDPETGALSVMKALDYDSIAQDYRLNVRAQDSGSPLRSNSTTVLVRVIDVNDNDPHFYGASYHESVLENVHIGYTVMKVQAYDIDDGLNGRLIYSLLNTSICFYDQLTYGNIILIRLKLLNYR